LLLIGQQGMEDSVRNLILNPNGWKDLQIGRQLQKMTKTVPTFLCMPPAASQSASIIGQLYHYGRQK